MKLTKTMFAAGLVVSSLGAAAAAQQQSVAKQNERAAAAGAVSPMKVATSAEEEAAAPSRPGGEGIKVHGHWVLDIRNADGTLARHLDFENSLTTGAGAGTFQGSTGDQIVAALLSGSAAPSDPGISFVQAPSPGTSIPAGTDVSGVCSGTSGVAGYQCGILTTTRSLVNYYTNHALSVQAGLGATVNFRPNVNWVLSGNFTVPSSGMTSLTAVQTLLPLCVTNNAFISSTYDASLQGSGAGGTQTLAPGSCNITTGASSGNITYGPLTQTTVPGAPMTVTPGQVITVTVTISFS